MNWEPIALHSGCEHTHLLALGPAALLARPSLALLCSAKTPAGILLALHDLAQGWRRQGPVIWSGFQSPVQSEALAVLLRGPQPVNVLCWLTDSGRGPPRSLPTLQNICSIFPPALSYPIPSVPRRAQQRPNPSPPHHRPTKPIGKESLLMFFRKPRPEDDNGKRAPKKKSTAKKSAPKKSSTQNSAKGRRRLDSTVPQIRPDLPPPVPPRPSRHLFQPTSQPRRGAPLSPETEWLLRKMSLLSNVHDYRVFKEEFIERYWNNPHHSRASAERAFYSAVEVCLRRLRR